MALSLERHAEPRDLVRAAGLEAHELDARAELPELDGERGRPVLAAKGLVQLGMAAVDADPVAGNVRRGEEGKPHDVVPVHV